MSEKYKFKDKQYVFFKITEDLKGIGKIIGVATVDMPVVGPLYIVKVLHSNNPFPNEEYPFSTIAVPEINITEFHGSDVGFINFWLYLSERSVA